MPSAGSAGRRLFFRYLTIVVMFSDCTVVPLLSRTIYAPGVSDAAASSRIELCPATQVRSVIGTMVLPSTENSPTLTRPAAGSEKPMLMPLLPYEQVIAYASDRETALLFTGTGGSGGSCSSH